MLAAYFCYVVGISKLLSVYPISTLPSFLCKLLIYSSSVLKNSAVFLTSLFLHIDIFIVYPQKDFFPVDANISALHCRSERGSGDMKYLHEQEENVTQRNVMLHKEMLHKEMLHKEMLQRSSRAYKVGNMTQKSWH